MLRVIVCFSAVMSVICWVCACGGVRVVVCVFPVCGVCVCFSDVLCCVLRVLVCFSAVMSVICWF